MLIPFEEALKIINTLTVPLSAEKVPLMKSLNRILAEDIKQDTDMPPFDKSAMDGYACRKADLDNVLEVIEEIPAGKVPQKQIGANQCARIMTGAMVPHGADFVVMKEHVEIYPRGGIRCIQINAQANICYRGEDGHAGDVVLSQGQKLLPAHIAIMAASGYSDSRVYQLPRVAVVSTGNELVEPGAVPGTGKIRNSNGYQLTAQVMQQDLPVTYLGIVPDDARLLSDALSSALDHYDLILISGGVSVGDYDFVPEVLNRLGVEILFHGMQVKPGKHMLAGRKGNRFVMGLPGNPVSSFVQFEVLVKPLLGRMMGMRWQPVSLYLPLEEKYTRKKSDIMFFIPVSFSAAGTVVALEYHGSAHINSYAAAQGIMTIPVGVSEIQKGEIVHVRPI
jgi:molybdopterin molybdotransferase